MQMGSQGMAWEFTSGARRPWFGTGYWRLKAVSTCCIQASQTQRKAPRRWTESVSPRRQTQTRRTNQTMTTMTKISTTVPIPMYMWTHLS